MIIEAAKSGHTPVVSLLLDYPSSILVMPEEAQISSGMNTIGQVPENSEDTAVSSPTVVTESVPTPAPRLPPVGVVATAAPVYSNNHQSFLATNLIRRFRGTEARHREATIGSIINRCPLSNNSNNCCSKLNRISARSEVVQRRRADCPLGVGLASRNLAAGTRPNQLQKSPSAPPLKRHAGPPVSGRPAFEFPAPPPPPHSSAASRAMGRSLRHRSDESLSGIGSSMLGEVYSTQIHSSTDDVSSANRSEQSESETEDGSSDESYTKTEAEVDPNSPGTSPSFRIPSLLPLSLYIEKAWPGMNAEFTANELRTKVQLPSTLTKSVVSPPTTETIELKGIF